MVLVAEEEKIESPWAARVRLLLTMSALNLREAEEILVFQDIECTTSLVNCGAFWGCISVQLSTDDELDHSVERVRGLTNKKRLKWDWFVMEPLDSIQKTVNLVCESFGIEPFTSGPHWPQHQFYTNWFCKGSGEEATTDSDID